MRTPLIALACSGALVLASCTQTGMSRQDEASLGGALAGAAVGTIAAKALQADSSWTIVAALGGAAAGALVARNANQQQCAYSRGDGTYYVADCP